MEFIPLCPADFLVNTVIKIPDIKNLSGNRLWQVFQIVIFVLNLLVEKGVIEEFADAFAIAVQSLISLSVKV